LGLIDHHGLSQRRVDHPDAPAPIRQADAAGRHGVDGGGFHLSEVQKGIVDHQLHGVLYLARLLGWLRAMQRGEQLDEWAGAQVKVTQLLKVLERPAAHEHLSLHSQPQRRAVQPGQRLICSVSGSDERPLPAAVVFSQCDRRLELFLDEVDGLGMSSRAS